MKTDPQIKGVVGVLTKQTGRLTTLSILIQYLVSTENCCLLTLQCIRGGLRAVHLPTTHGGSGAK